MEPEAEAEVEAEVAVVKAYERLTQLFNALSTLIGSNGKTWMEIG